jgi:PPK2 family polyphosphate:nucleotide phosphotransferase
MKYSKHFCVKPHSKVDLSKWDPAETLDLEDKQAAKALLKKTLPKLSDLQYRLYSENKRAVLIVLQAMDAGGKDGTIRHVMGPLNPQGCPVTSFKAPTEEEREHDFLWRIHKAVPRRGEIGIFNRSHYEDVLVVRVHNLVPKNIWSKRYKQINDFEKHIAANGVHILKFYLHISKDEQLERFKARIEDPRKHWKVNPQDFEERKYWDDYMAAFEQALEKCSMSYAPWYIIPANKKWFRNVVISQILLETLESFDMKYPPPSCDISKIKVE